MYNGRSNELFFSIVGGNLTFQKVDEGSRDGLGMSAVSGVLDDVLNLGVRGLVPGTLQWSSNAFVAEVSGGRIVGTLEVLDGLPRRLTITGDGKPYYVRGAKYMIEYEFKEEPIGGMFPNSFTTYRQMPGEEKSALVKCSVYNAEIALQSLDPALFSPYRFIIPRRDSIYMYSNSAVWYRVEGTSNQLAKVLPDPTLQAHRRMWLRSLLYGLSGTVILGLVLRFGWSRIFRSRSLS